MKTNGKPDFSLTPNPNFVNRAVFYDKSMGEEVDGALLGEQYNGYVFKITGGQDLQGFAMIQGVF